MLNNFRCGASITSSDQYGNSEDVQVRAGCESSFSKRVTFNGPIAWTSFEPPLDSSGGASEGVLMLYTQGEGVFYRVPGFAPPLPDYPTPVPYPNSQVFSTDWNWGKEGYWKVKHYPELGTGPQEQLRWGDFTDTGVVRILQPGQYQINWNISYNFEYGNLNTGGPESTDNNLLFKLIAFRGQEGQSGINGWLDPQLTRVLSLVEAETPHRPLTGDAILWSQKSATTTFSVSQAEIDSGLDYPGLSNGPKYMPISFAFGIIGPDETSTVGGVWFHGDFVGVPPNGIIADGGGTQVTFKRLGPIPDPDTAVSFPDGLPAV